MKVKQFSREVNGNQFIVTWYKDELTGRYDVYTYDTIKGIRYTSGVTTILESVAKKRYEEERELRKDDVALAGYISSLSAHFRK